MVSCEANFSFVSRPSIVPSRLVFCILTAEAARSELTVNKVLACGRGSSVGRREASEESHGQSLNSERATVAGTALCVRDCDHMAQNAHPRDIRTRVAHSPLAHSLKYPLGRRPIFSSPFDQQYSPISYPDKWFPGLRFLFIGSVCMTNAIPHVNEGSFVKPSERSIPYKTKFQQVFQSSLGHKFLVSGHEYSSFRIAWKGASLRSAFPLPLFPIHRSVIGRATEDFVCPLDPGGIHRKREYHSRTQSP